MTHSMITKCNTDWITPIQWSAIFKFCDIFILCYGNEAFYLFMGEIILININILDHPFLEELSIK